MWLHEDQLARVAAPEIALEGDVPSPIDPPSGCRFRTRCWKAAARRSREVHELEGAAAHHSACRFAERRAVG